MTGPLARWTRRSFLEAILIEVFHASQRSILSSLLAVAPYQGLRPDARPTRGEGLGRAASSFATPTVPVPSSRTYG
jgi:hypothetical protein